MTINPENNDDNLKPEDPDEDMEAVAGDQNDNSSHSLKHPKRVRRRIKVRKRVRIKKKPNSKKKLKKIGEKVFWIAIIVGFIVSLIIMIIQLDISDKKFKKQRNKKISSIY
jgi:cell division protein FtsL